MEISCPACRVIEGKFPGKGKLCSSCCATEGVRDAYDWFMISYSLRKASLFFTYVYPFFSFLHPLILLGIHRYKLGDIAVDLTCCWLWYFNVFYFFPKYGISRSFRSWGVQLEKARDSLFIAKVGGRTLSEHGGLGLS